MFPSLILRVYFVSDTDIFESLRMAPLVDLCVNGDLEGVQAALARGDDVNAGTEENNTGLMAALSEGHNSIVKVLLQQSSLDINRSNSHGFTAVHFACKNDNVANLRMLLGDPKLTSVNARNNFGWTPLMIAVCDGSVECVRELVRVEGVDLETMDPKGRSLEEMARWVECRVILGMVTIWLIGKTTFVPATSPYGLTFLKLWLTLVNSTLFTQQLLFD